MLIPNKDLMAAALLNLKGNWGPCVGVAFIYLVITCLPNSMKGIGALFGLALGGPMAFGLSRFFLSVTRKQELKVARIFEGFSYFINCLVAYLLMILFVLLWALLLIVPGIMAALSYSLTFYVLADNPEMGGSAAIKRSKELMTGKRLKMFYLGCRFIGWALLSILTAGIGFLWLIPYINTSVAAFYEDALRESGVAGVA
jgi:uncharacterized membrane protein